MTLSRRQTVGPAGEKPGIPGAKSRDGMEQKGVVASPSQLPGIGASALPRSNQTEATLFDEGRNGYNGELLMKRLLLSAAAIVAFAAPAFAADLAARPRPTKA